MNDSFMNMFDSRAVKTATVCVLAVLALFLVAQTISTLNNIDSSNIEEMITVTGNGQATLPPDVARISFTIENVAQSVSDAQKATTKLADDALAFIEKQGVEDKDVKTLYYNISPEYAYPNPCAYGTVCPDYYRAPKITGYKVSETIQVTVRDLEKVGEILGGLGKLEVQNLNGPSFALDDPTAGYDSAREDAINKAKAQAKILAKQLGVRLGDIVSFSESSGGYPYPMYGFGMGGDAVEAKAQAPSVPAGENTYKASVSITYKIR